MGELTRDIVLQHAKVERRDVPMPWLGNGYVAHIHGMTMRERSEYERQLNERKSTSEDDAHDTMRQSLLLACWKNADGTPMFEQSDFDALGEFPASWEPLVEAAIEVCGLSGPDVETLAGN